MSTLSEHSIHLCDITLPLRQYNFSVNCNCIVHPPAEKSNEWHTSKHSLFIVVVTIQPSEENPVTETGLQQKDVQQEQEPEGQMPNSEQPQEQPVTAYTEVNTAEGAQLESEVLQSKLYRGWNCFDNPLSPSQFISM